MTYADEEEEDETTTSSGPLKGDDHSSVRVNTASEKTAL